MPQPDIRSAARPAPDPSMVEVADYVVDAGIDSAEAYDTARYMLLDSLACAMLAMKFDDCVKHLGPLVPGGEIPGGARVPGTAFELDPAQAARDIGTLVRWLDFNDTWLAAEWGHPSDNLGAVLAVADCVSRTNIAEGKEPLTVKDVLEAMIIATEIQGVMALENSFNKVGLDHVILVKLASTAAAGKLLGLSRDELVNAISHVFVDGQALRTYRQDRNTGSRKSWAAADATARAGRLALIRSEGRRA